GLDLIRRIKQINKSVRMLVVSMHDEKLFGERVLDAGAMGYLNKQAASRKIVDAVQKILNGERYISDELSEQMETRRLLEPDSLPVSGVESLTDRELDVFCKIGAGLTTVQIATKMHLSVKTIESHRQKIKAKLNLRNAA